MLLGHLSRRGLERNCMVVFEYDPVIRVDPVKKAEHLHFFPISVHMKRSDYGTKEDFSPRV
jgi:hypothetical protein